MAPVTRAKKKEELSTPVNQSQSASNRGVKRSVEDEEKEQIEVTSTEKKGRQDEKATDMLMEKVKEEKAPNEEDNVKKGLIEAQQESNDILHSETSFMELPDEIHTGIFTLLDLPSRLNLRVNKRLDRTHFSVKAHLTRIELTIGRAWSELKIDSFPVIRRRVSAKTQKSQSTGFLRFAQNTSVDEIKVVLKVDQDELRCRVVNALFHFKANKLSFSMENSCTHSDLTLPSFLTLAQNVREVNIAVHCTSLTAQDACIIRKTMLEDDCKMKSLNIRLTGQVRTAFLKECFGVTIERVSEPVRGRIYRCEDESHEMYLERGGDLHHLEGDFRTSFHFLEMAFEKLQVVKKPDNQWRIRLNHVISGRL